jgi:hypothetical protein
VFHESAFTNVWSGLFLALSIVLSRLLLALFHGIAYAYVHYARDTAKTRIIVNLSSSVVWVCGGIVSVAGGGETGVYSFSSLRLVFPGSAPKD